jgi:hypothetical protein
MIKTYKTKQYYCPKCKKETTFKIKQQICAEQFRVAECSLCKWKGWTSCKN